jgi:Mce-associated membrane protein
MAVDADTAEQSLAASLENSDTHLAQSRKTLRLALAAVLVTLAALIGVGVWTGHQIAQEHQADEHQEMLVGVARQAALNLTTIDHTSVDSDIKRILDSSTGTFHDDFQKRADPFVQAVTEAQSTSVGTVTEAGMESQEGDDTKVLVAVAVKTSSAGVEEPQPRAWRMRITVTQPSGQDPKVSNVQFVP